jgi:hypothetical protein
MLACHRLSHPSAAQGGRVATPGVERTNTEVRPDILAVAAFPVLGPEILAACR